MPTGVMLTSFDHAGYKSYQAYRQALPDDRGDDAGVGGVSGAANARSALYQASQNLTTMNPKMGTHDRPP